METNSELSAGMKPERWNMVEELYHAAQAQPVGQRAEFLRRTCPDDAELLAEVESLLRVEGKDSPLPEGWPVAVGTERASPQARGPAGTFSNPLAARPWRNGRGVESAGYTAESRRGD